MVGIEKFISGSGENGRLGLEVARWSGCIEARAVNHAASGIPGSDQTAMARGARGTQVFRRPARERIVTPTGGQLHGGEAALRGAAETRLPGSLAGPADRSGTAGNLLQPERQG